jgi:hypothetical protein
VDMKAGWGFYIISNKMGIWGLGQEVLWLFCLFGSLGDRGFVDLWKLRNAWVWRLFWLGFLDTIYSKLRFLV